MSPVSAVHRRTARSSCLGAAAVCVLLLIGAGRAEAAISVDRVVTTKQAGAAATIVSPAFSTTSTNEVLLAFIASDGPRTSGGLTISTVTGAGLTWRFRRRANTQFGTAEIWQAVAPNPLSNVTVTARRSAGSYQGMITVAALIGADPMTDGATGSANATTGPPTVSLLSTRAGSWTWGIGDDWDRATARTVGAGQTKVDEYLAPAGDTFWVQRMTDATPTSGATVTLNDTAPTTDRWNFASIEVLPAGADTQPPSAPTNLAAGTVTATRVPLTWTAATDNFGVAGYRVFRDGAQVGDVTGTSFTDTSVTSGATYTYTVKAYDAVGLVSDPSNAVTVTTPVPDTSPPTVSVTSPADNATVSGTINVAASASDDVGVAGVQFVLDGADFGSEDTTAPYGISWNTTTLADGNHTLAARARDTSGNTTTSATITAKVNNAPAGSDPSVVGQWGPVISLPAVAIHSALLPNGKVLLFQGDFAVGGMQYVFDPATGTTVQVPDAAADLFCAGQAVLADGRVLVVGGTGTQGALGIKDITAFDWRNNSWNVLAPMHHGRWYATATTIADGSVLVNSGSEQNAGDLVGVPELYTPLDNTWRDLTAATHVMPYYPFIYQLPDGRIAHLGGSEVPTPSEVLNLSTNQWSTFDSRDVDGGSIANYAPGKFMKAGSASDSGFSGPSARTAFTLDMNQTGATWQPTGSMTAPRSFLNLTNLPDGTVLATGGGTDKSGYVDGNAVLTAESWDPGTGTWTAYSAMARPRLYHSVAVLLPDGRVYVAGGGGDNGVTDQKSTQIFSPPYLFKGPRPTITSAPDTVKWGDHITVGTPDGAKIRKVTLIRSGSVTHSFDQNARATPLTFSQKSGGLDVTMPADGNIAPPGYYMLFIVDDQGVPSVASFVRFPAPYEDDQAPTQPTNLNATGKLGGADLTWSASSDNVGVTRYDVHRSSTSGFTPSAANKVGQSTTTSFADTGVPAGTYFYKVVARDAAGNASPASAEATATVRSDTTPPTVPANVRATANGLTVTVTWDASSDDVGVTGYRVLRNGTEVGAPTSTTFTEGGLAPNTTYTYTVVARDAAGNPSDPSAPATVTTGAAAPLALDRVVTTKQSGAGNTIASPALTTAEGGEVLVAFLASDGPNGANAQSFSGISGGGLTWTLRRRANTQAGTAEIWQAVAPAALTNVVFTATRTGGSAQGMMTVAAFKGADPGTSGATASANAATGAPTVNLTTTRAGSWVWAVGDDWDRGASRTVGPGQTMVDEFLAPAGDTFWVQRQTSTTPAAGTQVTINDTAPTTDRWNLAAVEVLPAG